MNPLTAQERAELRRKHDLVVEVMGEDSAAGLTAGEALALLDALDEAECEIERLTDTMTRMR